MIFDGETIMGIVANDLLPQHGTFGSFGWASSAELLGGIWVEHIGWISWVELLGGAALQRCDSVLK
jgi:hypothetical protein